MSVCVQLTQMAGENVNEVSGIKEVSGIYLESADAAISVECLADAADRKIKLLFRPNGNKNFTPFSISIPILTQRIIIARLVDDSKIIILPESMDEEVNNEQEIQAFLQRIGGMWIDGLPQETIKEIIAYCS
jgi:hypothetical protein